MKFDSEVIQDIERIEIVLAFDVKACDLER